MFVFKHTTGFYLKEMVMSSVAEQSILTFFKLTKLGPLQVDQQVDHKIKD